MNNNIFSLIDIIEKFIESVDSDKNRVFDKHEIENLIVKISNENNELADFSRQLLLTNYNKISKLTDKNKEIYVDPDGQISIWDLKKLLEILENLSQDKRLFKESTLLNEEVKAEIIKLIEIKSSNN